MSLNASAWAWQQKPGSTTNLIVLLAVADDVRRNTDRTQISQAEIAEQCLLTERSVMKALKALEKSGYIKRHSQRGQTGSRLIDIIQLCFDKFPITYRNDVRVATGTTFSQEGERRSGRRVNDVPDSYKVPGSIQEESGRDSAREPELFEPSKPKKRMQEYPDGWSPDLAFAIDKLSLSVAGAQELVDQFRDHHRSRENKFADWDAAWRNWVRNEKKFGPRGVNGSRRQSIREHNGQPDNGFRIWKV